MIFLLAFAAAAMNFNFRAPCAAELVAELIPPRRHAIIYDAVTDSRGRHYALQPPLHPERVKLIGNFVEMNMVSDLVRPIAIRTALPKARIVAAAHLEWYARRQDLLFSMNFGMMRGPILNREFLPGDRVSPFDRLLLNPMERIYRPIPSRYARQGPERADIADRVIPQDQRDLNRLTRFSLSRFTKPMAYTQVLVSRHPGEPLRLEEEWGDQVADLVRSRPGEVIGELKRFALEHPNHNAEAYYPDQYVPLRDDVSVLATNAVIQRILFQKVLAWINSDARLDRLLIQINRVVERRLLGASVPLQLGTRREVHRERRGRTVTEIVYAFDRPALLRAEEVLYARVMQDWLRYVLRQKYFQFAHQRQLMIFVQPNEAPALARLGIYEKLFDRPLPLAGFGNWETHFVLGIDQIPEALKLLKEQEARALGADADEPLPFVAEAEAGESR